MKTNFQGLTVNERLHAVGLIEEFDQVKNSDKIRATEILRQIEVDEASIEQILS